MSTLKISNGNVKVLSNAKCKVVVNEQFPSLNEPFWANFNSQPVYEYAGAVTLTFDQNSLYVAPRTSLTHFKSTLNSCGGTINAENCTSLRELNLAVNALSSVNITNNTSLTALRCQNNLLRDLNVTSLTELKGVFCFSNPSLSSINVSGCSKLTQLYCQSTNLSSLDITSCINLIDLRCNQDKLNVNTVNSILTSLDSFGKNNGTVDLRFGANAVPTGLGLTAKTSLQSRGWSVLTNV